jgi:hypothetical protein
LIGVLAIVFVTSREPVSLTFSQYEPWPAAKLKLTNNSRKTITYLTGRADAPVLSRLKTSARWTNTSRPVISGTHWDAGTGQTNQIYLLADLATFKAEVRLGRLDILQTHELEPGQSAELYVSLEAYGPPTRVGTVCIVPQGKLAQQFGHWVNRVKGWCHIKPAPPGQVEVWCNEPLQISSAPVNAEKR